jgi:hypothetical protein
MLGSVATALKQAYEQVEQSSPAASGGGTQGEHDHRRRARRAGSQQRTLTD